jgi:hypothetical protein
MTRCSSRKIAQGGAEVQPDHHVCDSYREFECAGCGRQTHICRCCDRGHGCCPTESCADCARAVSMWQYRADYQRTRKGKKAHARAQLGYRLRSELRSIFGMQLVTEQSSTNSAPSRTVQTTTKEEFGDDALAKETNEVETTADEEPMDASRAHRTTAASPVKPIDAGLVRCDFCRRLCRGFIHRWSRW